MLYKFSQGYISPSEFTALMMASTYPIAKSIFDVAKRHILDPVSILVLLGITASAIALLAGGSPRISPDPRIVVHRRVWPGGLCAFATAPADDVLLRAAFHGRAQSKSAARLRRVLGVA